MDLTNQTPLAALTVGQFLELFALRSAAPKVEEPRCKFLSIDDAVEVTGYSKNTLYKLVSRREIPFYKSASGGRKLTFLREELEAWMAGQRFDTNAEFIAKKMGR